MLVRRSVFAHFLQFFRLPRLRRLIVYNKDPCKSQAKWGENFLPSRKAVTQCCSCARSARLAANIRNPSAGASERDWSSRGMRRSAQSLEKPRIMVAVERRGGYSLLTPTLLKDPTKRPLVACCGMAVALFPVLCSCYFYCNRF